MQRIKLNVFKSWFDKNLTGKEIDFLLVLSFYQDKRGVTKAACNGSLKHSDGGQTKRCKCISDLPEKFYKKICKYKAE